MTGLMSLLGGSSEPWTIYGGVPAKPIMGRRRDVLRKGQDLLNSSRFMHSSTH